MKKYMSFLLAGAMVLSVPVASFGANFSDINNVPWPGAETYINQAADSGLMVGENVDGNMVFRAKDPVTLVETAQLVYNLLKTSNHLDTATGLETKWNSAMTSANIPQWAYTSVAYCLEHGIVTESELKTFVSGTTNTQATREQVAGMIGKAIDLVDETATTNSAVTTFKDNNTISADKVPYIAMLSSKSILSGDDLGNFNPKNNINRAEMAVMITKSNDVLKNVVEKPQEPAAPTTGSFTAQIEQMQATGSNIMLALYNGTSVMGYMGDDTVPTTYQDGTEGKFSDVTVGTSVTITYNGSRITKMVINTDAPKQEEKVLKGNIATINNEEIRVVKGVPYYFASDVEVTIDGKSKDVKDLIDAYEDKDITDVYVELTLDTREDVSKVVATTKAKSYEDSGTIKKLTTSKITFENGTSYQIDEDNITVKYNGSTKSLESVIKTINDADSDDTFTANVEINEDDEDYIDRLEVKSGSSSNSSSGSGSISSVSGSKIKVGSKTYTIESSTDIDIDDGNERIRDIDDLETAVEEDDKTIEVDVTVKDDKVTKITGYVSSVTGDLFSVDTNAVTLDLSSSKFSYDCESDVTIDVSKDCDNLDELDEYKKDEGSIKVELTISKNNEVTKIKER